MRVSRWFTRAGLDLIGGWPHSGQNARKDQVSLSAQDSNELSAHPLSMKQSIRAVGFIRVGSNVTLASRFTLSEFIFVPPMDFFALPDSTVLGDEVYGDPLGIG